MEKLFHKFFPNEVRQDDNGSELMRITCLNIKTKPDERTSKK